MKRILTFGTALVALISSGCERQAEPEPAAAEQPVESAAPEPEVFRVDRERESLPRSRIYYTLTDHEWYARGQPLLHDGRAYQPVGLPVSVSMSEMTKAGEYEGVEYYARRDDPLQALYVPVFEGYWLSFRSDTLPRAAAADSPPT